MSTNNNAVYLVVGGSGGIGADVARQLAAKGTRLVVTGRDTGRLAVICAETGGDFAVGSAGHAAVDAVLQQLHATHGRLDGVVNCAGSILLKPAHMITDAEFAETLALNLTTAFNVLARRRACSHAPTRRRQHRVLFVRGSAARAAGPRSHRRGQGGRGGAGTVGCGQLRALSSAGELRRTGLTRTLTQSEPIAKASAALHPLGCIWEPAEVASAICWLLDGAQAWVTGQVIGVDGGLGNVQPRG